MTKYFFRIYYAFAIIQLASSLLQLIFPRPENPMIADSSGLLILQDFYGTTIFYLIFTTIYGIYLLAVSNIYLKNKLVGRVISMLLILSIPLFIYLFFEFSRFLRNNFNYVENGFIKLYQDAVILGIFLVIFQLGMVIFLHRKIQKNVNSLD